MVEQIAGDLLAHIDEAGCPAEHADPVIVAFAVDIGAGLDQQPDRLHIAMERREMQRRGVVRKVATVEIGAALDQQADGGMLVAQNRQMQRRGFFKSAAECVDILRMCVEAGAERVEIAGLRRPHDGLDRMHLVIGAGLAALDIAGENLDRLMPPFLGDLMHRAAVGVGRCGIKARRKGAPDRLDVAGACGFENAIAVAKRRRDAVDMRLQRAPALEAIVMGERELGLVQLGIRLAGA